MIEAIEDWWDCTGNNGTLTPEKILKFGWRWRNDYE